MSDLDTALKRRSAINIGLPFGRVSGAVDGNDLEDRGERESANMLYALNSSAISPTIFGGGAFARAAVFTGVYGVTNPATSVRPAPVPIFRTSTWRDQVRYAEGREFAHRNRYVAYSFGGAKGPKRQFWDDA